MSRDSGLRPEVEKRIGEVGDMILEECADLGRPVRAAAERSHRKKATRFPAPSADA